MPSPKFQSKVTCAVCGHGTVEPFLDLGSMALANQFLTQEELSRPEPKYPLRAGFCKTCHHVQLMERVPPKAMFENYLYVSSASDTLKTHLYELSDAIVRRYHLGEKDLVMDIGCNDGTLLRGFKRHGVRTLGVDPAKNLEESVTDTGIDRYTGFFDSRTAKPIGITVTSKPAFSRRALKELPTKESSSIIKRREAGRRESG